MINKTIARRYAQALFEIAREKNAVEKFAGNLQISIHDIVGSEDGKKIFFSRFLTAAAKKEMLQSFISSSIDPVVKNFLYLILDKSREQYLEAIGEAFSEYVNREQKVEIASVKAPVALSGEQIKRLEEKLARLTGHSVKVETEIDPALIGGMSVKIGDTVYDGSIVKQLSILKQHLQQVQLGR